jgi:hypothetical protein
MEIFCPHGSDATVHGPSWNDPGLHQGIHAKDAVCASGLISSNDFHGSNSKGRQEFMEMMKDMPRELLLVYILLTKQVLRNQNYMRFLNAELNHPVNRYKIMARSAIRGTGAKATHTAEAYNEERARLTSTTDLPEVKVWLL